MNVLQARAAAQHLAFGPVVFQAVRLLWKSGVLGIIEASADSGCTPQDAAEKSEMSLYGIEVLCEVANSAGLITESDGRYRVSKMGSVLLHDKLTQVNFDFVHDICYQGMFFLDEAIRERKPAGLKVFSDAQTIYQCVTDLPEVAQHSWYDFDHYYSDRAFSEALEIVFSQPVKHLLDIGGNTGKWALLCLEHSDRVEVTIADLPGQLDRAKSTLSRSEHSGRAHYHEIDLLDPASSLPTAFDAVWMSQFIDCFSEREIAQILSAVKPALAEGGRVYIMETLVDRQRYDAATYSLNAISLYFTAMANGNSRMYRSSTLERILDEQGYRVAGCHDDLGLGHTLLECQPV